MKERIKAIINRKQNPPFNVNSECWWKPRGGKR